MNKQIREYLRIDQDFINNAKLHLAMYNRSKEPHCSFCDSWKEWAGWTRYKTEKNDWNKKNVITFFKDKRNNEDNDLWIFGGCFEVIDIAKIEDTIYITQLLNHPSHDLIGKLVVKYHKTFRQVRCYASSVIDEMEFSEELETPIQSYDPYEEEWKRMKDQTEELTKELTKKLHSLS